MITKSRHRPLALLLVAAVFPLCAAAQRPLNPLVARSERPTGTAPAECEQGLSPAPVLRAEVREIPIEDVRPAPAETPAPAMAPPSGALRAALQETQAALMRNDRPAFDAALARELSLVSSYPGGGERRVADDVVRLHETAARLWDAQYRSPFFGEDDPEYKMVSAWPGYAEAVRRGVYTDEGGRRFYPAGESREFVTRLAAERLQRGGMNVAPSTRFATASTSRREVMTPRAGTPRVKRNPVTTSRSSSTRSSSKTPSSSTRSSSTTPSSSTRSSSTRPSSTRSSSTRSSSTPSSATPSSSTPRTTAAASSSSQPPSSTPEPAPTAPAPSSPNPSAPPAVAAAPAPAPAVATDQEPVTTSTPVAGDVSSATVAATTTDPVAPTTPPARGRSVILPTILILIGLGVLIVLFRASK